MATAKTAKKNRQLELELKSVYAQLNPHFIFNSLNAALYLVKMKKFPDAYDHIYKFSHLMRAYIKSSRNRYIALKEEIANLKNYIELQQVRFKDKFDYNIFVEETVDTDVKIPSLLFQPLVENAIIHGLLPKETKGNLSISFADNLKNDEIICTIDDDGIGRIQSKLKSEHNPLKGESFGGDLIKDLVEIFNKYEKIKIGIEYIDKEEPITGTIVKIKIKFH
jgi:sensor histidine kinase YesM